MLLAAEFTDTRHATIIYLAAGGLVVLGLVLVAATVVWWRSTKVEHPVLAPLEVMGDRAWWKATPAQRQRMLAGVRPAPQETPDPLPQVDLAQILRADPPAFDDLAEVSLAEERVDAAGALDPLLAADQPGTMVSDG